MTLRSISSTTSSIKACLPSPSRQRKLSIYSLGIGFNGELPHEKDKKKEVVYAEKVKICDVMKDIEKLIFLLF